MEPTRSSGGAAGSGNSGTYTPEAAESLRFEEEIQSLMRDSLIHHGLDSPPASCGGGSSSFTALLGLPPTQAVELLHGPEQVQAAATAGGSGGGGGGEMWREKALRVPFTCSPTFPSNAALVERAARLSAFATEDSSADDRSSPPKPKVEPADYGDGAPIFQAPVDGPHRPGKRKDGERSKSQGKGGKKCRGAAEEVTGGDKLPYVHVRARRGQATDSHSLAERARREKINARMKLLQELVPGCSKITGTALVLDEIINHVQSLQRQVEFLSMRLAAVNPRIDFSGLDSFLSAECGRVGNGMQQTVWPDWRWQQQQQAMWQVDMVQQQQQQQEQEDHGAAVCWETGGDAPPPPPHEFMISPGAAASLYGHVSIHNQLKTEL